MALRQLKIAQITSYYAPYTGGVPGVVRYLSEGLAARGHEVHVFTADQNPKGEPVLSLAPEECLGGVAVHRFRTYGRIGHAGFFPGMALPLMRGKFDVIHVHSYRRPHGEMASHIGRHQGVPTILHCHGGFVPAGLLKHAVYGVCDGLARLGVLNRFDHYVALTESDQASLAALGVGNAKVTIIPNAAADDCFKAADPAPFRRKHQLEGKKVILYLSSLHPFKRPDLLISALPQIIEKEPDAFVILVGPDAGELSRLSRLGETLRVADHFRWIGVLRGAEKHEAFAAADMVVLPSDEEPFPLVLLEAMAHGKPVVGSDATGPSAIIGHGETGFIFPRGRADELAVAILRLLENPELRKKMGDRARAVALSQYSVSRALDLVEGLYARVLGL